MRGKGKRNDRMGWRGGVEGVIRYILLTFAQRRSPTRKQYVCVYISKYVFKFSAVSCFKTHLTDYLCVRVFNNDFCGVPRMLLLCCRLFLGGGSRQVVGGGQGEHNPESPGAVKRSQSREG